MTPLPRVSGKTMVQVLKRSGFTEVHRRSRRSRFCLQKPGEAGLVTIPLHANQDLVPGTLRSIPRQANLTVCELVELLNA